MQKDLAVARQEDGEIEGSSIGEEARQSTLVVPCGPEALKIEREIGAVDVQKSGVENEIKGTRLADIDVRDSKPPSPVRPVLAAWFQESVADCRERNAGREGAARVPLVAIYAAAKRFEPPTREEGIDHMFGVQLKAEGFDIQSTA